MGKIIKTEAEVEAYALANGLKETTIIVNDVESNNSWYIDKTGTATLMNATNRFIASYASGNNNVTVRASGLTTLGNPVEQIIFNASSVDIVYKPAVNGVLLNVPVDPRLVVLDVKDKHSARRINKIPVLSDFTTEDVILTHKGILYFKDGSTGTDIVTSVNSKLFDATLFKAVGSENTLGLNVNDNTLDLIFEKLNDYVSDDALEKFVLTTGDITAVDTLNPTPSEFESSIKTKAGRTKNIIGEYGKLVGIVDKKGVITIVEKPSIVEVDAGEAWEPNTEYKTKDTFVVDVVTDGIDKNGVKVKVGKQLFTYGVDVTSPATVDINNMEIVSNSKISKVLKNATLATVANKTSLTTSAGSTVEVGDIVLEFDNDGISTYIVLATHILRDGQMTLKVGVVDLNTWFADKPDGENVIVLGNSNVTMTGELDGLPILGNVTTKDGETLIVVKEGGVLKGALIPHGPDVQLWYTINDGDLLERKVMYHRIKNANDVTVTTVNECGFFIENIGTKKITITKGAVTTIIEPNTIHRVDVVAGNMETSVIKDVVVKNQTLYDVDITNVTGMIKDDLAIINDVDTLEINTYTYNGTEWKLHYKGRPVVIPSVGDIENIKKPKDGQFVMIDEDMQDGILSFYVFGKSAATGIAATDGTVGKWNRLNSQRMLVQNLLTPSDVITCDVPDYSGTYSINKVIDGNIISRWRTATGNTTCIITITPSITNITATGLQLTTRVKSQAPKHMLVKGVNEDGSKEVLGEWNDVGLISNSEPKYFGFNSHDNKTYKQYELHILSNNGSTSISLSEIILVKKSTLVETDKRIYKEMVNDLTELKAFKPTDGETRVISSMLPNIERWTFKVGDTTTVSTDVVPDDDGRGRWFVERFSTKLDYANEFTNSGEIGILPTDDTLEKVIKRVEAWKPVHDLSGQFSGVSTTYAGLSNLKVIEADVEEELSVGDFAILNTVDGTHIVGFYVKQVDGTFGFVMEINNDIILPSDTDPLVNDKTAKQGTSLKYSRADHVHPTQPVSTDANNLLTDGSDGQAKLIAEDDTGFKANSGKVLTSERVVDEDDFASNTDLKVPTQSSVKNYIDNKQMKLHFFKMSDLNTDNETEVTRVAGTYPLKYQWVYTTGTDLGTDNRHNLYFVNANSVARRVSTVMHYGRVANETELLKVSPMPFGTVVVGRTVYEAVPNALLTVDDKGPMINKGLMGKWIPKLEKSYSVESKTKLLGILAPKDKDFKLNLEDGYWYIFDVNEQRSNRPQDNTTGSWVKQIDIKSHNIKYNGYGENKLVTGAVVTSSNDSGATVGNMLGGDNVGFESGLGIMTSITIDLGAGKEIAVGNYGLFRSKTHANWDNDIFSPTDWYFEGSNDGAGWTEIEHLTNQVLPTGSHVEFIVNNTTKYRYYRFTFGRGLDSPYFNITNITLKEVLLKPELRGTPVVTTTELKALEAKEYEQRLVKGNSKEYVFKLTADLTPVELADVNNLPDDLNTGKWVETVVPEIHGIFEELVLDYDVLNSATPFVSDNQVVDIGGFDASSASKITVMFIEGTGNKWQSEETVLIENGLSRKGITTPYGTGYAWFEVTSLNPLKIKFGDIDYDAKVVSVRVYKKTTIHKVIRPSDFKITNPTVTDAEMVLMTNGDGTGTFKKAPNGYDTWDGTESEYGDGSITARTTSQRVVIDPTNLRVYKAIENTIPVNLQPKDNPRYWELMSPRKLKIPKRIRYIRLHQQGSLAKDGVTELNDSSHIVELKVFNEDGTNVVLNKLNHTNVRRLGGVQFTSFVDADIAKMSDGATGSDFFDLGHAYSYPIEIDLGKLEYIDKIQLWRYYDDERVYKDTKVEVSDNGIDFSELGDGKLYNESSSGKTFKFSSESLQVTEPAYYSADTSGSQTGVGGYIWYNKVAARGSNINISSDKKKFTLAPNGSYRVSFTAMYGSGSSGSAVNVGLYINGAQIRNTVATNISANWGSSGGGIEYIVETGNASKVVHFERTGSTGNGNILAQVTIEEIVKAVNVVPNDVKPAFAVCHDGGSDTNGYGYLMFNHVYYDTTNSVDSAGHQYICPKKGIYSFTISLFANYTNSDTRIQLFKNGGMVEQIGANGNYGGNNDKGMCLTVEIQCDVGDKIWFGSEYGSKMHYYATRGHNRFSGHLITEIP